MNKTFAKIVSLLLITNLYITAQNYKYEFGELYTAEDIKDEGIITLNDLFELSERWFRSGINGYNFNTIGNLLGTYQEQNLTVFVNGQQINLNFLNDQNLDLLPFTVDQIDTVLFLNTPRNYKGVFAPKGLISIKLKKPGKGFSINAMQSIGNQVGDPGPYAYTPYRTSNVDKLGYIAGLNIRTSGNEWNLAVNLKYNENFVTDNAIDRRINYLTTNQKARLLGTSTDLQFNLLGGKHDVIFAFSQDDNFFFTPQFGNEIPARRIFRHLGFNGYFPLSGKISLKYDIIKSINERARVENNLDLNFNLSVTTTTLRLASEYKTEKFTGLVGLKYAKHDANRSGFNNDEQINFTSLFMSLDYNYSGRGMVSTGLELVKNADDIMNKFYIGSSYTFNRIHNLALNASYSETSLNEELNYYTWLKSGEPLITGITTDNNFPETTTPKKQFTADLTYTLIPAPNYRVALSGLYREFKDYYLPDFLFSINDQKNSFTSVQEFGTNEFLKVAGVSLKSGFPISSVLSNKVEYLYQIQLKSSEVFEKEWGKIPTHTISYKLEYEPVPTFKIWTKISYITSTEWSEYKFVTYQSNYFYNYKIDDKLLFDLSMQKYLWQNRLWVNLLFKNIFNQQDVQVPIGISRGLRFYLILQLQLDSVFN